MRGVRSLHAWVPCRAFGRAIPASWTRQRTVSLLFSVCYQGRFVERAQATDEGLTKLKPAGASTLMLRSASRPWDDRNGSAVFVPGMAPCLLMLGPRRGSLASRVEFHLVLLDGALLAGWSEARVALHDGYSPQQPEMGRATSSPHPSAREAEHVVASPRAMNKVLPDQLPQRPRR